MFLKSLKIRLLRRKTSHIYEFFHDFFSSSLTFQFSKIWDIFAHAFVSFQAIILCFSTL